MPRRAQAVTRRAACASAGFIVVSALVVVGSSPAAARTQGSQVAPSPPPFVGTASADGVRVVLDIPGFPLSETPVDVGGPTAQAMLDSLANSTAYAAFPDPGPLVISVPGLVTGLLAGGAVGLPPIKLPTLPSYPLAVEASTPFTPEASSGAGLYALDVTSDGLSSVASASGGLQSAVGNIGLIDSHASVAPTATGTVVAQAITDFQGLTVGPLTIGEVKAMAMVTIDNDGSTTPSDTIAITGVRIGGLSVDITPTGLNVGGLIIAIPIAATLAALLKAAGIQMQIEAAQMLPDGVIAPALQLSMPVSSLGLGRANGTLTITIGAAEAHVTVPSTSATTTGGAESSGTSQPSGGLPLAGGSSLPLSGGSLLPSSGGSTASAAEAPGLSPNTSIGETTPQGLGETRPAAAAVIPVPISFNIESIYLLMALLAVAAIASATAIRLLGVKAPWKSPAG